MVSNLALGAIWGYQNYLSPRKGFRCAHSVLYGGTGCSGYAKYAIRNHGFWKAIPDIRKRFADCRTARDILRSQCAVHANEAAGEDKKSRKKRRQNRSDWAEFCSFSALAGCCGAASSSDTRAGDPPASDASSCDGLSDCSCGDCTPSCDCAPSCS